MGEESGVQVISDDDDDNHGYTESRVDDEDDDGANDNVSNSSSSENENARNVLEDLPSPLIDGRLTRSSVSSEELQSTPESAGVPDEEGYESSFVDDVDDDGEAYEDEDNDWTPPYEEYEQPDDASENVNVTSVFSRSELRNEAAELQQITRGVLRHRQPEQPAFRNAFMEISDDGEVVVVETTTRGTNSNSTSDADVVEETNASHSSTRNSWRRTAGGLIRQYIPR